MESKLKLKLKKEALWIWWVLALVLILGGGFLAHKIQTYDGICIKDVRFMGSGGKLMSGLLYIPPTAGAKTPAPGIVAIHGYINSRETQDGFAIEFARRGYVVLAVDQPGHGFSDPPAFANGFGGPDSLKYLRSLDFVDPNNVALEGHSMGGWAALSAAAVIPDGYQSIVVTSSSTGTFGVPQGTATYPRNMALIYSKYDEFSTIMWGAPVPAAVVDSKKARKVFNIEKTIQVGKQYGDIAAGTARKLYQPSMIHPRTHFSTEAIGDAVEWMQATLNGGNDLAPSNQIWIWKEIGTLIALIGMVVLIFPTGLALLKTSYFKKLAEAPASGRPVKGYGWWISAVLMILIPLPVYVWAWSFHGSGIAKARWVWGQQITTTVMFWALGVALISIVLFLLWHFLINRKSGALFSDYGMIWAGRGFRIDYIGRSFILAVIVVVAAYLSLAFSDWAFKTDYRFWVFAVKPMIRLHFAMALAYIIPFILYFLVMGLVVHGQMRKFGHNGQPLPFWKEALVNIALLISGFIIFFLYQYIPLFSGATMAIPELNLATIVMFQFVPMFILVALVSTFFYRRTGHLYVGAFTCALLVTWTLVAGQATHFPY